MINDGKVRPIYIILIIGNGKNFLETNNECFEWVKFPYRISYTNLLFNNSRIKAAAIPLDSEMERLRHVR